MLTGDASTDIPPCVAAGALLSKRELDLYTTASKLPLLPLLLFALSAVSRVLWTSLSVQHGETQVAATALHSQATMHSAFEREQYSAS